MCRKLIKIFDTGIDYNIVHEITETKSYLLAIVEAVEGLFVQGYFSKILSNSQFFLVLTIL